MKHNNFLDPENISALINAFKLDLEKGTVIFYEEPVFLAMIDQCFSTGFLNEAINISENALEQHPFSSDILIRLAKISIKLALFDKSDVTIDRLYALSPQSIYTVLLKSEYYAAQNKHYEARAFLQAAKTSRSYSDEERSEVFLLEALILDADKRYNDMFRALKNCLLLNPNNQPAYRLMFWVIECTGFYNAGIVFYNKLISNNAYNANAWLNLGYAHTALNEREDALEAFGYCFAIDEKCLDAYIEAGDILLQHKKYKEAQSLFERALQYCGDNALTYQKLGVCYMRRRRFKRANEYLIKSLELDTMSSETHFFIGKCAFYAGQWSLAVKALESAIALDDSFEDYHAALGEAYVKTEAFLNAIKCFRRATMIAPENIEIWLKHIEFLIEVGQIRTALKIIEEAELNTGAGELVFYRIGCLFTIGKHHEAMALLSKNIDKNFRKKASFFQSFPNLEQEPEFLAVFEAHAM